MTGKNVVTLGNLGMNVLDTLGLIASSFGQWWGARPEEGGSAVEVRDDANFRYLRLEFRNDVLIGATSLGMTENVGVIRGLIQGRVPLGPWKERLMHNPAQLMDAYLASAQKAA
jgi:hypothetical protein